MPALKMMRFFLMWKTKGIDACRETMYTNASFTLDTYTHVTTDMQKNASIIVGDFMEELFGKELKPWERNESPEKEHSD